MSREDRQRRSQNDRSPRRVRELDRISVRMDSPMDSLVVGLDDRGPERAATRVGQARDHDRGGHDPALQAFDGASECDAATGCRSAAELAPRAQLRDGGRWVNDRTETRHWKFRSARAREGNKKAPSPGFPSEGAVVTSSAPPAMGSTSHQQL